MVSYTFLGIFDWRIVIIVLESFSERISEGVGGVLSLIALFKN